MTDIPKIESHLGEGGMANVYLAHDVKHDRKVAVQVLLAFAGSAGRAPTGDAVPVTVALWRGR